MTIRKVVHWVVFLWGLAFGVGVVLFFIKIALDVQKYFPTTADYLNEERIAIFLTERWHQLVLVLLLASRVLLITTNSERLKEYIARCFAPYALPVRFEGIYGGRLVLAGIAANAGIFVACLLCLLFTDEPALFFALLSAHWALGLVWMVIMRRNLASYFSNARYLPGDDDPLKSFILARREALTSFVRDRHNLKRYVALTTSSIIAASAWMFSNFEVLGTIVYVCVFVADAVYALVGRAALKRTMAGIDDAEERLSSSREDFA